MEQAKLVDRFLSWPLPKTVCSDACVMDQGRENRVGTNLLTADEARQMLSHVLSEKMKELNLQERARNATEWYIKQNFPHFTTMNIEERTRLFNGVFAGFFMGVRWHEGELSGENAEGDRHEQPEGT